QRLTTDILDVTKIESNSLKLNKERFNLSDLISGVVDDFKNEVQRKGAAIRLLYEPKDYPILEADKARLTQVISNILGNAIKFSEETGGEISVSTEVQQIQNGNSGDGQVLVSVKDNGAGIDPTIMPRLFTKFATNSENGIGLGLYISKSIVEAHGGRIWAENNPEDAGAAFYFMLPILSLATKQQQ
ncbi:MAG TPA: HAMP domain-containing sensor histidine kinase, partial [Phototrophicaceae bacterium]|nr:HAMP domain-containing sensor histidine kinase [Phototrophicaceae bacterium]